MYFFFFQKNRRNIHDTHILKNIRERKICVMREKKNLITNKKERNSSKICIFFNITRLFISYKKNLIKYHQILLLSLKNLKSFN